VQSWHDDLLRARLLVAQGRLAHFVDHDIAKGLQLAQRAYDLLDKTPDTHVVERAQVDGAIAELLMRAGKLSDAVQRFRVQIDVLKRALGPKDPMLTGPLGSLANLDVLIGRLPEALALLDEQEAIVAARYGEDHVKVGLVLQTKGHLLRKMNRTAEALSTNERAAAILKRLGPNNIAYAGALREVGLSQRALNRHADALATLEQALEVVRPSEQPAVREAIYEDIVDTYDEMHDKKQMIATLQRSLAEPTAPDVLHQQARSFALVNAGRTYLKLGDPKQAVALLVRARAGFGKLPPSASGELTALHDLGIAYLALKRPADAIPVFERFVQIVPPVPSTLRIEVELSFARALYATGKHADAKAHATAALGLAKTAKDPAAKALVKEIADWLAKHGST
jgi:tetratricopeptide (TPR) repeat protein